RVADPDVFRAPARPGSRRMESESQAATVGVRIQTEDSGDQDRHDPAALTVGARPQDCLPGRGTRFGLPLEQPAERLEGPASSCRTDIGEAAEYRVDGLAGVRACRQLSRRGGQLTIARG